MHAAEVREGGGDVALGWAIGCAAADDDHRVVERRQGVLGAREQQEVHGGQEQQRPSLGERRAVEEREHLVVVGHGPADGRVGGAAVTLDHGGEAAEVVGERLLDEHGG